MDVVYLAAIAAFLALSCLLAIGCARLGEHS